MRTETCYRGCMDLLISKQGNLYERLATGSERAHRIVYDTSGLGDRHTRRDAARRRKWEMSPESKLSGPGPVVNSSPTAEEMAEMMRAQGLNVSVAGPAITITW